MRIAVLTSGTNNTPPFYEPLRDLGHEIAVTVYDAMTHDQHRNLPLIVERSAPDWVLYIGAIEAHHSKPVPSVSVLAEIGSAWPLVHFCCDGGEPHWWSQLERYYADGRFALQVNVDGVRTGPIGDRGLTLLCPVDAARFNDRPWSERRHPCGFAGGLHGGRTAIIPPLEKRGLLVRRGREPDDGCEGYRGFLEDCCVGINVALTGGGTGLMHVKHRAGGELPAAGCLVLESAGSPLADWFTVGEDYLEYGSLDEAAERIRWAAAHRAEACAMAQRMRAKVVERHSPAVFWSQVMERLGLCEALRPVPEVPYRPWSAFPAHPPTPARPVAQMFEVAPLQTHVPILVGQERAVNLVAWQGKCYAIPQRLGAMDLTKTKGVHPAVKSFGDVSSARSAVKSGAVA